MNLAHIFTQDSPVLTATFLLLVAMSVTSWYLIFRKAWLLSQEKKNIQQFRATIATTPDWPLRADLRQTSDSNVRLLLEEAVNLQAPLATYDQTQRKELYAMHLAQKLDGIRLNMDQGLTILASIGSSAPFIGLFGTVWGVYNALMHIAQQGNAGLNVVSGPMGEALVATAIGLFTAIPAVLAYNGFVRMSRVLIQDLRHIAEQITAYITLTSKAQDNIRASVKLVREN